MRALLMWVGTIGFMQFISMDVSAQDFQWAHKIGNAPGVDGYTEVTEDANGNLISVGLFSGSTNIHPNGTFNLTSAGDFDIFISKLDASGNFIWGKQIGGTGYDAVMDVLTDANDNIYICGYFDSPTMDADPGAGVTNLTGGNTQTFIIKLDPSGNFLWANSFGSTGSDLAYEMDFDLSGDLIVGGSFAGTVDFDPSPAVNNLTATNAGFILKLSNAGAFVSVISIGSAVTSIVSNNSDYITIGGFFSGTMDLDPFSTVSNFTATGTRNGFTALIDNSTTYWITPFYGAGFISVEDVLWLPSGHTMVAVHFTSDVKMNPASSTITTTNGDTDIALIKLQTFTGLFAWGNHYGGIFDNRIYSMDVDASGYLYLTLDYESTIDADAGAGVQNFTSNGMRDFLLMRLETVNGTNVWVHSIGSVTTNDAAYSLKVINSDLLVAGIFGGTMDVNMGSGVNNLTAAGTSLDGFMFKSSLCSPLQSSLTDVGCGSYVSPSGLYTWTTSGIYTDVLYSSTQSCDSTITCDITIINSDSTLTILGNTMTANQSGANYQWIECNTQTILTGETGQSFLPTVDGTYGVIINNGGCISTSDCYTFSGLSIEENRDELFNIFPNPANDLLELTSGSLINEVQIYDLTGKSVLTWNQIHADHMMLDIASLPNGAYVLFVKNESGIQFKNFMKLK